jgi:hypothetical protein
MTVHPSVVESSPLTFLSPTADDHHSHFLLEAVKYRAMLRNDVDELPAGEK